jgi:hypothetical protein
MIAEHDRLLHQYGFTFAMRGTEVVWIKPGTRSEVKDSSTGHGFTHGDFEDRACRRSLDRVMRVIGYGETD